MMRAMKKDWPRLAAAIKAAREARGMTQVELADAAGVVETTVQNLEDENRTYARTPPSLKHIERALGWAPGSVTAVLEGGEPTSMPESSQEAPDMAEGMPLLMSSELRQGKVVDTVVADLSRPGARSKFLVIWKTDDADNADITPEDVAEWSRIQRTLHGLPTSPRNRED